jgi:hypothetical protein
MCSSFSPPSRGESAARREPNDTLTTCEYSTFEDSVESSLSMVEGGVLENSSNFFTLASRESNILIEALRYIHRRYYASTPQSRQHSGCHSSTRTHSGQIRPSVEPHRAAPLTSEPKTEKAEPVPGLDKNTPPLRRTSLVLPFWIRSASKTIQIRPACPLCPRCPHYGSATSPHSLFRTRDPHFGCAARECQPNSCPRCRAAGHRAAPHTAPGLVFRFVPGMSPSTVFSAASGTSNIRHQPSVRKMIGHHP